MTKHCPTCGAKAENTANFCRLDGARLTVEQPQEIGATVGYETLGAESPDLFGSTPSRPTAPASAEPTTPYPLRHVTAPTATAAPDPERKPRATSRLRAVAIGIAIALLIAVAPAAAYFAVASAAADQAAAQISDGVAEPETSSAPEVVAPAPPLAPDLVPEESAPAVEPILGPTPVKNAKVVRSTPRPPVRRASVRSRRSSPASTSSGSKSEDKREKKQKNSAEDESAY